MRSSVTFSNRRRPIEWASWHPSLNMLAKTTLENFFIGSTQSLLTCDATDIALEAIENGLCRKNLPESAKKELLLLRKAVVKRGYELARREFQTLLHNSSFDHKIAGNLTHHPAYSLYLRYIRSLYAVKAQAD